MHCPLCGYHYRCPCNNCDDRNKELEKWPFLDGEFQDHQFCPCCGLVLYVDEWLGIEVDQHKIMQELSNQSGGCICQLDTKNKTSLNK